MVNRPTDLADLRALVLETVPGVEELEPWDCVLALREWVAERIALPGRRRPVLLKNGLDLVRGLLNDKGGVMCSGAAVAFGQVLHSFGISNWRYDYRWTVGEERFSHDTNVVQVEDLYYMVDAYLSYHFTDPLGKPLPLPEMLGHIAAREYDQIRRVDLPVIEPKTGTGKGTDGQPAEVTRIMSVPDFLLSRGRVAQFRRVFGEQSPDELLLDMILINPHLEPGAPVELQTLLKRLRRLL